MKKIASIATIALFAIGFTSCKKEYTCTCVTKVDGMQDQTVTSSLGKQKKKDAEAVCSGKPTTTTSGGMTATQTCTLK